MQSKLQALTHRTIVSEVQVEFVTGNGYVRNGRSGLRDGPHATVAAEPKKRCQVRGSSLT